MYWERQEDNDNNKTESPYVWFRAPSAEIEITSYALLANIVQNQPFAAINARPIVMWLSKQRNSQGGFGSTQVCICIKCAISDHCINFDLFDKDLPNIDQNRTMAYCIQGKFHPRFIFALLTL